VRAARAKQLEADGLAIISPHGNANIKPKLVTAETIAEPFDAVVVAVKAYALAAAIKDFAPAVGPDTMIVPLLNGMRHMDVLADRFGANALTGGLCRIAAALDPQGRITQLADFHDFVYGERDGSDTVRMQALDAAVSGAGFNARLSSRIDAEMWEKWVMMAALGGITCLMRGTVGEIEAATGGREFVQAFLDEVVQAAVALSHPPSTDFLDRLKAILLTKNSTLAASMYRDLAQGNPIEADQIMGDLLARATQAGVKTPLLATAYAALCVYQNRSAVKA
jgi:2-dehydropantoate 2-reductase